MYQPTCRCLLFTGCASLSQKSCIVSVFKMVFFYIFSNLEGCPYRLPLHLGTFLPVHRRFGMQKAFTQKGKGLSSVTLNYCNRFNFYPRVFGQCGNLHCGTGRASARKVLGIRTVHRSKLTHIL